MGLMPAYRAEPDPLYSLKTVCIAPGNPARGLDSHQGFVALFDGVTGEPRAFVNASAITAVRTAAVSAVATRLLARPGSRTLAILGAGVQARSHLDAMRAVLPLEQVRVWSRTPEKAAELDGVEVVASAEEALAGADVVVTATTSREPVVRARVACRRDARQRRRLEHLLDARARQRDDGRRRAVRRPARVDDERVGRLPVRGRGRRGRAREHPRRDRRAAERLGRRGAATTPS